MYIEGQGFEWLEDPKHLVAIIRNRSKTGAKPYSSPGSKYLGKSDPGIIIYVSIGRFDM